MFKKSIKLMWPRCQNVALLGGSVEGENMVYYENENPPKPSGAPF